MKGKLIVFFLCLFGFILQSRAEASIVLNEIFADPPSGLAGDANNDGVTSSGQDEFIELVNSGAGPQDISNWLIKDATSTRHVFPSGTILLAQQYLVIFGGGSPDMPGISYQLASTGTLSLNNTSEEVSLFDENGNLIDLLSYGADGGKDQSLVRFPEATGNFVLHSSVSNLEESFSPGKETNPTINTVSTPENPVWLSFLLGCTAMCVRRKLYNVS